MKNILTVKNKTMPKNKTTKVKVVKVAKPAKLTKIITAESIKVDNFSINRSMGESSDWKRLELRKKQIKELNEIGYSGKLKNKKTTLEEYFKKNVDTKSTRHIIGYTSSNNMEYTDTLLVTRIIIK